MSEVLRLVLKDAVARPGEPFTCVVLLDPHDERVALAQKLTVSFEWRATEKFIGNVLRKRDRTRERKVESSWSPELPLRMEYHATLTLPDRAPVTYDGKLVTIEWFLVALLDVPRNQNGYVELPVRVVPRGST